ncbi:MAG: hypothetical protein K2K04_02730, partial [Clostridia bacterium]|nr:hypothetical protein [Clostridia bacterium]
YYGLAIMVVIMVPNIIYAVKCKDGFKNKEQNKALEIAEQVGRYACFVLMVFNIPYTYWGFRFKGALIVYLAVEGILCLIYLIFWAVFRGGNGKARALALSVTPAIVFLFGGVMLANIPLIAFAVVFAVCHIWLSLKNAE